MHLDPLGYQKLPLHLHHLYFFMVVSMCTIIVCQYLYAKYHKPERHYQDD